jgi:hypothetical protein
VLVAACNDARGTTATKYLLPAEAH